jgi:hypothetical protein
MKQLACIVSIALVFIAVPGWRAVLGNPPEQRLVLLELFTSQGCSSCPPADALLGEYAGSDDAQIVPLSFHVDYWNRLGWKDPFSSALFSERQQQYSRQMHLQGVYTPQAVVDGKTETVGNNRSAIQRLVAQERLVVTHATIAINELTVGDRSLDFHYQASGIDADDLLQIALAQKKLTTNIRAGENKGVVLTNHNVVRTFLTRAPDANKTISIGLPAEFKRGDYILVIFLQNRNTLAVRAVAAKPC